MLFRVGHRSVARLVAYEMIETSMTVLLICAVAMALLFSFTDI